MQHTTNDVAGSAVFWTLGASDYAAVSAAFQAAGFGSYVPETATEFSALRAVLSKRYPKSVVQPVKNAGTTFEVVSVASDPDAKRNQYDHVVTAYTDGVNVRVDDDSIDYEMTAEFIRERNTIPYHSLSSALVKLVYMLGGTTLRPTGGLYWIPNRQFDKWEQLANGVELAGSNNKVFALRTVLDVHSAAVLREALAQEIAREATAIRETVSDPESGQRAIATCRAKARHLRDKIGDYEREFSMILADLTATLDDATNTEAIATMLDAAADGPLLV